MDHHSVLRPAACRVHVPALCRSRNQHGASRCPGLTELVKRRPCAGAATGHLHFEYGMVIDRINRRRLEAHFGPIGIELIREDHRQRGKDPCPISEWFTITVTESSVPMRTNAFGAKVAACASGCMPGK